MTELVWNAIEDRRYESGVSRGVLYPLGGPGVAWNGLLSVEESSDGGEVETFWFDGIAYSNVKSSSDYKATLKAFTCPPEFDACDGIRSIIPGFLITRQPRVQFHLSYRTEVNEDDYKIHLVYNALATPGGKTYSTMASTITPVERQWVIDAVPPRVPGYRPTAHFVIESQKCDFRTLAALEDHLYGIPGKWPHIPDQAWIAEMFRADPEIIDGGSSSNTGPNTPPVLDGFASDTVATDEKDGRKSSTRRLEEYLYT